MPGIVHVVDDDASYLSAIQQLLEASGYRVATYASAQQLLDRQPDDSKGCILLDVRMPGISGLELQSRLTERGSKLPIIFLTAYPDVSITVKAIKAGADDFLIKPVGSEDLLSAISRAITRHRNVRALDGELEALRSRLSTLTSRQRQVFEIIVQGKTNKLAARELGSTERTVKAHRSAIMDKLQVQSVVDLVRIAERLGVLGDKDEPNAIG
ncbi:response regulator transcription factor [Bradyrhizobium stylosanthis]|uniref:LuxR family two component transcriptional regulator n=1 Tax=Bradyrhizobium stylosanthis TaxID=1803665 RepID=A0A560DMT0_9BRAD|nr:response regulator [Bradyrhizobium stylosanthis]TWA98417.1 LuxR family two component transcriptional regulator [Bradyrhizobium stylosanthis]